MKHWIITAHEDGASEDIISRWEVFADNEEDAVKKVSESFLTNADRYYKAIELAIPKNAMCLSVEKSYKTLY